MGTDGTFVEFSSWTILTAWIFTVITVVQLGAAIYFTITNEIKKRRRNWIFIYWIIHMPLLAFCAVTGKTENVLVDYFLASPLLLAFVLYNRIRDKRKDSKKSDNKKPAAKTVH